MKLKGNPISKYIKLRYQQYRAWTDFKDVLAGLVYLLVAQAAYFQFHQSKSLYSILVLE
jgi:hypothetical protein